MYMSPIIMMSSMVMVLSTLMVLTSTNWICLWISMELNMFSFIPIMMSTKNNLECEASIKYFINQAFASCIMIIMSFMLWGKMSMFYFAAMPLLMVSMMLKLGSSPCYMWFPSVMKALPWIQSMILATWQKVAPMMILLFNIKPLYFMLMIISMMNIFIGGWLGMNQVNIQSLLAYSSIAHMGWMFMTQAISMVIVSFTYFIIYMLILLPVFIMMLKVSMKNFKTINNLTLMPVNIQMCLMLMLLSLAGLPPLSGFLPKLMILFTMSTYSLMITLMMVIFSFMSLYFYLNLAFSVMMSLSNTLNYMILNKPMIMSMVSITILTPMIILLYAMIMFNKS
uniref:NADH-ubiquinone oxidoreductase chain 2 n=1 Tax=Erpobdella octoculata TaxID=39305 RepID=A0A7D7G0F4_9ANNE|nr:NADH dehydrogenase subunit 2 [Erpobdella octoculata]UZT67810.1 NADH dehydrogenase subunit 2 [Erpobdella octoculata]